MSAAEHAGCIPGQCRAGDQWRATGCGAEVDGATWGGGPAAEGEVEALVEAIRAEADKYGVTRSAMAGCGVWTVSVAQVPDIVRAALAARSQRPEAEGLAAEWLEFTATVGFGDGVTEPAATPRQIIDNVLQAFSEAGEYREGPRLCEGCGEWLATASCEHCHGSGCGPGTATGAYEECEWCAGVGKVHPGCVERSYADLAAAQRPEGVTVTEWGVQFDTGAVFDTQSERVARELAAFNEADRAVTRQRTTFPDVVTEWAEVSGDTGTPPEGVTCKALVTGRTDDEQYPCPHPTVEEWLDLSGQWIPVCARHGKGQGGPSDRLRPLRPEGVTVTENHVQEGATCSCGDWEPRLGESLYRAFDRHLLAVSGDTEAGGDR